MRLPSLLGIIAVAGSVSACSHPMQRCETLYQEQRYVEAAEAFERTEPRLAHLSAGERAEYGLYRGLTFLHLDDLASARTWLGYAYAIVHKEPDALPSDERILLDHGWAELDQRSRAVPPVGATVSRVADAETMPIARTARAPANGRRTLSPE